MWIHCNATRFDAVNFNQTVVGPKKENQFCCDPAALSTLSDSLKEIRKAVGECPSCYKNIRNLFCLVTCDRNRGKYFAIDEQNGQAAVKLNYTAQFDRQEIRAGVIDYDSFTMNITKLSFFMHSDFASKLFDSCSRVKNPISPLRAINNWCISCDPHRWVLSSPTNFNSISSQFTFIASISSLVSWRIYWRNSAQPLHT